MKNIFNFWVNGCQFLFAIGFVVEDLWIGIYWKKETQQIYYIYICFIPMLPLRLIINWEPRW